MGDRRQHRKSQMQQRTQQTPDAPKSQIQNICVYCGSNSGADPAYAQAARKLGELIAKDNVGLVYGGGSLGLMGELARSVLDHGGRVTGIIPSFLSERERMLRDADELIVVEDMHQRKKLMFDKSDAFVALPGGIGTLEELLEVATWSKLGIHAKPCGAVNTCGYYDALGGMLDAAVEEGFMAPGYRDTVIFDADPARLLDRLDCL